MLCCVVYDSCAQWYAHTYEQTLQLSVRLALRFIFGVIVLPRFVYIFVLA